MEKRRDTELNKMCLHTFPCPATYKQDMGRCVEAHCLSKLPLHISLAISSTHLFVLSFFYLHLDRVSDNDKMSETQTILQKQLPTRQSTPDSPSSLQNIPPGSKRKEIKSVKGVLNSGMNAPLNGGSRSRPPSTPGSPLVEYRMQLFGQQQQQQQQQQTAPGESSLVNGLSSAAARSAKVKSDLLMGLNSPNIRPDRFSTTTMKDTSESTQQQGIKMANGHGGFYASSSPYISNSYSNNANGYGSNPTTGAASGPPPGFGNSASGSGNNSPYLMSTLLGRVQENNSNKPLDVASMMSALDFFGPGQASSLMMSPNWNLANGTNMNDNNFGGNGSSGQSHLINGGALSVGSDESNGNTIVNTNNNNSNNHAKNANDDNSDNTNNDTITSASAHSVEDLELQVINAKMETQMLENQLNAVIKRNRRKLYA
ncbi:hypothetical protein BCR41DRAFT_128869 [Lobosporangium transversale]|uniref:Uncharacterized protein n=1 Tax=Lobosporangium transversale TaxID=64571 RepID=A0A1Y2GH08_9FUNG|nr:hypothetical protein BCR41DRAFT_128869 [Lobosporangium transversale]ORZ10666.1 hypothetical protein BCR41DRAFT_128869 [Lobosporangium transversale]|eukprot:XP_021879387.1 hypothetical protein BCR41DRAFT_128869 [Lobosporangium transversale]